MLDTIINKERLLGRMKESNTATDKGSYSHRPTSAHRLRALSTSHSVHFAETERDSSKAIRTHGFSVPMRTSGELTRPSVISQHCRELGKKAGRLLLPVTDKLFVTQRGFLEQ